MHEQFVSEQIKPGPGSADATRMAMGEPGLPRDFTWRNQQYHVDQVLEQWKESAPCTHGSGERYLRKHWYLVRTTTGQVMKIYFERQARSKRQARSRWWLYTVCADEGVGTA
jgi:phosphoribosylglycinamide formyltransferase-1